MKKRDELQYAAVLRAVAEFEDEVDEIYGSYLDSLKGFGFNQLQMSELQQFVETKIGTSPEEQDRQEISYSHFPRHDSRFQFQHQTTQAEFRERNKPGGRNFRLTANALVVFIYTLWEDKYRKEIATALGMQDRDCLANDLFGDLNLLRRSIVHRRGYAVDEIGNCKLFASYKPNDLIELTPNDVDRIVVSIKDLLDSIIRRVQGLDG